MRQIITLLVLVALCSAAGKEPPSQKSQTVRLPVMTWFHPLLEPEVSDMLILCTVSGVKAAAPKYMNRYWTVTLRIDERIHVAERYSKRLENIRFIESGDFRKRTVGERVILFAGGEPYDGDDFLLPCWSGTGSDLGIVLHPKGHDDSDKDVDLLNQLREAALGKGDELDLMTAFAEFCPKGVARHLIRRLQSAQIQRESEQSVEH